jgi:hypothetical protein
MDFLWLGAPYRTSFRCVLPDLAALLKNVK